ncbi:hypothetical protein [Fusibacter sp. 3D3]|uniref:hypothetical protein n=1 Tax=Fusibacter sp. 3D3 TaxID=1048380 RepID=UPI000853E6A5|nr:hypothetical protein [Fusibacter sp. 3D3]GAU76012.1 hypothetical protein F3D3_0608 [Fusibacter sp. 3D3]
MKTTEPMYSRSAETDSMNQNKSIAPVKTINIYHPRSYKGNNPITAMYQAMSTSDSVSDYYYFEYNVKSFRKKVSVRLPIKGSILFSEDFMPIGYNTNLNTDVPMLKYRGNCVCLYGYSQEQIASCFRIPSINAHVVEFELNEYWSSNLDISLYSDVQEGEMAFSFKFYYTVKAVDSNHEYNIAIGINSTNTLDEGTEYYNAIENTNAYLPCIYIKWQ